MKNIKDIFTKKKPERNKKIVELQKQGMSLRQIGKRFKISQERVRQICNYEKSKLDISISRLDRKRERVYTGVGK